MDINLPISEGLKVENKITHIFRRTTLIEIALKKMKSKKYLYINDESKRVQNISKLLEQQKELKVSAKLYKLEFDKFINAINKII